LGYRRKPSQNETWRGQVMVTAVISFYTPLLHITCQGSVALLSVCIRLPPWFNGTVGRGQHG